jgi:hypothetical protein
VSLRIFWEGVHPVDALGWAGCLKRYKLPFMSVFLLVLSPPNRHDASSPPCSGRYPIRKTCLRTRRRLRTWSESCATFRASLGWESPYLRVATADDLLAKITSLMLTNMNIERVLERMSELVAAQGVAKGESSALCDVLAQQNIRFQSMRSVSGKF